VILHSVLPVGADWKLARNRDVLARNENIKTLAHERKLAFIDLHPHFCDARGELRAALSNDGIHLGPRGYAQWC